MADLIADEMVETYAVTASLDPVAGRIRERYAGLVDRVGLSQPCQPRLTNPRWPILIKRFNG